MSLNNKRFILFDETIVNIDNISVINVRTQMDNDSHDSIKISYFEIQMSLRNPMYIWGFTHDGAELNKQTLKLDEYFDDDESSEMSTRWLELQKLLIGD